MPRQQLEGSSWESDSEEVFIVKSSSKAKAHMNHNATRQQLDNMQRLSGKCLLSDARCAVLLS